ncbi:hypothetical protein PAHAL_8G044600 [Panicum hallii]|uniref:Uncharacterized protein n=1 Tax=Panicum hallii TaxID=206008 RepID=A0A2T8I7P3_9POAL|nr:hypothetical protein PAHAL_8G044600 [Panicum hallii]
MERRGQQPEDAEPLGKDGAGGPPHSLAYSTGGVVVAGLVAFVALQERGRLAPRRRRTAAPLPANDWRSKKPTHVLLFSFELKPDPSRAELTPRAHPLQTSKGN